MTSQLFAFVGVCAIITLVPGLDTALVTRNVVAYGRRAGIVTSLGTSSGLFVHAVAVALGVSAILVHSAAAFTALKLCGAVYLTVLGLRALWASRAGQDTSGDDAVTWHEPARSPLPRLTNPYMQGLLTNVTNPKAALFFLTFLPQFLSGGDASGGAAILLRALALAAIPVAMNLLWLSAYAFLIGRVAQLLRRPAVRRLQERVLGIAFVGLGIRLAVEHR